MPLNRFSPCCVVTNPRGQIVYIHGRSGRYLEPAVGEPSKTADGTEKTFAINGRRLHQDPQLPGLILLSFREIQGEP